MSGLAAVFHRDGRPIDGDSVWDMKASGRAGVTGIGVRCGGISEAELRDAGAAIVYEDPEDIVEHLEGSLIAKLKHV